MAKKKDEDFSVNVVFCEPESRPLVSLDELLEFFSGVPKWLNKSINENLKPYRVPLLRHRKELKQNGPKTLLCHDMKGGYIEDRFNDGHFNSNAYRFYYWSLIDIFVYFSHHLITIPPIGWISAAHRNGVPCFGTVIVEHWAQYQAAGYGTKISGKELIKNFLHDSNRVEQIVTCLVNVSKYFNIDGWLINIETEIPLEKIKLMKLFVRMLTEKMHQEFDKNIEDFGKIDRVIWYDSVVSDDGSLKWQNELNHRNQSFFHSCDGIFLNYCWKRQNLINSAKNAGHRNFNVYAGVDVFGRGCFGGGGFNSNLALDMIHSENLSVALFAPGWTHETLKEGSFSSNEFKFWSKLAQDRLIHLEKGVAMLPLETSFCQGFGPRLNQSGQIVSTFHWFDLNRQELQPCFDLETLDFVKFSTDDAYDGGGCLHVELIDWNPVTSPTLKLFKTKIFLNSNDNQEILLKLNIFYKILNPYQRKWITLEGRIEVTQLTENDVEKETDKTISNEIIVAGDEVKNALQLVDTNRIEYETSWQCDQYTWKVNQGKFTINSIGLRPTYIINQNNNSQTLQNLQIFIGKICFLQL